MWGLDMHHLDKGSPYPSDKSFLRDTELQAIFLDTAILQFPTMPSNSSSFLNKFNLMSGQPGQEQQISGIQRASFSFHKQHRVEETRCTQPSFIQRIMCQKFGHAHASPRDQALFIALQQPGYLIHSSIQPYELRLNGSQSQTTGATTLNPKP